MRSDISAPASGGIAAPRAVESNVGLELVRATEAAALAAGRWMGNQDRDGIRATAATAMYEALSAVHMNGTIVLGDDQGGRLAPGRSIGEGSGEQFDVAVKAIDGSTLLARGLPNAV